MLNWFRGKKNRKSEMRKSRDQDGTTHRFQFVSKDLMDSLPLPWHLLFSVLPWFPSLAVRRCSVFKTFLFNSINLHPVWCWSLYNSALSFLLLFSLFPPTFWAFFVRVKNLHQGQAEVFLKRWIYLHLYRVFQVYRVLQGHDKSCHTHPNKYIHTLVLELTNFWTFQCFHTPRIRLWWAV